MISVKVPRVYVKSELHKTNYFGLEVYRGVAEELNLRNLSRAVSLSFGLLPSYCQRLAQCRHPSC